MSEKSDKISKSIRETRERRKSQTCRTYTYMMEYLNSIPNVEASFVVDIGSFVVLT